MSAAAAPTSGNPQGPAGANGTSLTGGVIAPPGAVPHAPGASNTSTGPRFFSFWGINGLRPFAEPAPQDAISIRDFIALVRAEEAKWPFADQTRTSLMITRLRKIFYGTQGWDDHLIPGAASIPSGYGIREQETGREDLECDGPDADIVRTRQIVTDGSGHSPEIADKQEVKIEDGTFDDIGHVLAGLDAANHPSSVTAPWWVPATIVCNSNVGAVTWTGDLGSVIAEICFYSLNRGGAEVSGPAVLRITNDYAPPQDMLGDMDAYVIADAFDISDAAGVKVSDVLSAYYLGSAASTGGSARDHRYSRFCRLVGLAGWSGGAFANESDWIDRWTSEVGAAAAFYVGATTAGLPEVACRFGYVLGIRTNPMCRIIVRDFLSSLKQRVAEEPS